ncbi:helix-turn-helix transcriptional regulator [Fusibacter bizertensis]|uniref:Helix-turn-helix transcriptional regulator n=1 Tax=Fusibacter bizertensis TaxID=1488331 RepID=A0ABT6NAI5_9FIRM|nr:helix-turn-helix transcriptional regulator [Fusibacter bizertensis]MDH8677410.1 helix-turn-helix transcriptional regulator [Fusibacter bizertensis]
MTFGEKLQLLRKEKSISQEQFAEVMNVSRQAVSKWELNQSYPEMDKLIEVSKYFEVSLDYLMKDERVDSNIVKHNPDEETHNKSASNNNSNSFTEIYKVILLTALAIGLTSIRFFILGDFKVGLIMITISCIFIVGFYMTKGNKRTQ